MIAAHPFALGMCHIIYLSLSLSLLLIVGHLRVQNLLRAQLRSCRMMTLERCKNGANFPVSVRTPYAIAVCWEI